MDRTSLACVLYRHWKCLVADEETKWECPCDCHTETSFEEKVEEANRRIKQYWEEYNKSFNSGA